MSKFPPASEVLGATPHRPSAELTLLAGIYDLLRELLGRAESTSVVATSGEGSIKASGGVSGHQKQAIIAAEKATRRAK